MLASVICGDYLFGCHTDPHDPDFPHGLSDLASRLVNRRVIAGLSAFLIIFQMVTVQFVSATSQGALEGDCDHAGVVHPWHPDDGCNDGRAVDHAGATQHHARAGHQCRCVHSVAQTPIAADLIKFATPKPESEPIAVRLVGPAFPAPLFDLLRPPD